jgi:hypothetical protein
MIGVKGSGDFHKTKKFLGRFLRHDAFGDMDRYGRMGVDALAAATPVDTGLTADSWDYRVIKTQGSPGIEWFNTNMAGDTPVAILIQYGHATGTGGYVQGIDFINPAILPVFETIADEVWKEVTE